MVLLIAVAGTAVFRSVRWFIRPGRLQLLFAAAAGLVIAGAVEWWGLIAGRWQYNEWMPIVPGTPFGVVPIAQMIVLAPLTLFIAGAIANRRFTA